MTPGPNGLTLGEIHRVLRGQVGVEGGLRVGIAFEQHTSMSPTRESDYGATVFSRRFFKATLDFDDDALMRANLQAGTMANEMDRAVELLRRDEGYAYSVDDLHYGEFEGDPDLFDLGEFEAKLQGIPVRNLTVAQVRDHKEDVVVDSFDVDLDPQGFIDLVRIFGDAVTASEGHTLDTFTVHLTSGGDLLFDYWWKTLEAEPAGAAGGPEYDSYVSCHVTIRLAPASPVMAVPIAIDTALPIVSNVDAIWALTRQSTQT